MDTYHNLQLKISSAPLFLFVTVCSISWSPNATSYRSVPLTRCWLCKTKLETEHLQWGVGAFLGAISVTEVMCLQPAVRKGECSSDCGGRTQQRPRKWKRCFTTYILALYLPELIIHHWNAATAPSIIISSELNQSHSLEMVQASSPQEDLADCSEWKKLAGAGRIMLTQLRICPGARTHVKTLSMWRYIHKHTYPRYWKRQKTGNVPAAPAGSDKCQTQPLPVH